MAIVKKKSKRIVDIALVHVGEKYILGARAPLGNKAWKGPWDCAEFASWCTFQASGIIYGAEPKDDPLLADAYTGYWAEHASRDNALVSVEDAVRIPGAVLLRVPMDRRTGHIAISDGLGGTIEAHSLKRGVVKERAVGRRWDYGVLVPNIEYQMTEDLISIDSPTNILRLNKILMFGTKVRKVQRALIKLGYSPGKADGIYGPQTAYAVRQFQLDNNLVPDGEVGEITMKELRFI